MKLLFFKTLFALSIITQVLINAANAQQLLMLEQEGCAYCEQWHEEIGDIYPKTWEGKRFPLRRVDIHEEWPADLAQIRPEVFTPTFVLIDKGQEVGRLRGYSGDEFFWFLIDELIEKLE